MRILFIHQNFPGQFRHIAQAWAARPGWQLLAIGRDTAPGLPGVRCLKYKPSREPAPQPKVWRELDEWLRHRLRAGQLKHWKRPSTIYRELKALGAAQNVAKRVAVNSRRWWRNSDGLIKTVLTIAYFDRLGVPRLS